MDNVSIMVATDDMAAKDNWVMENVIKVCPFIDSFNKDLSSLYSKYREMWGIERLCVQFKYYGAVFCEVWLSETGVVKVQNYLITDNGSVPYYSAY